MITCTERAPGITIATVTNDAATAEISLYGGQLLSYKPAGSKDILFTSVNPVYKAGKAIRGGVPVCWPWFGPHPTDKALPQHGFLRTMNWKITEQDESSNHSVVTLGCSSTTETLALWPHPFTVSIAFFIGKTLSIALTSTNTGSEPYEITDALHAYFRVGDISRTTVSGFDGTDFIDRVGGKAEPGKQSGVISIAEETDRVYLKQAACTITDTANNRETTLNPQLFPDTVIWNPWAEKAKSFNDFGAEEYRDMICVEAGSVLENKISVKPGTSVLQCLQILPGA